MGRTSASSWVGTTRRNRCRASSCCSPTTRKADNESTNAATESESIPPTRGTFGLVQRGVDCRHRSLTRSSGSIGSLISGLEPHRTVPKPPANIKIKRREESIVSPTICRRRRTWSSISHQVVQVRPETAKGPPLARASGLFHFSCADRARHTEPRSKRRE